MSAIKRILTETAQEAKRLGIQGSAELASALFNGHGFVPYGPGQNTPSVDRSQTQNEPTLEPDRQQDRGGIEL